MKLSKNKISIIGLIAIASIVALPFTYAAVEPHIMIKQDPGQTQNPFTVRDNVGTDLFVIQPDGSYTGKYDGRYNMFFNSVGNTTTTAVHPTNDSSNPIILKRWNVSGNLNGDNVSGISQAILYDSYLNGMCVHLAGAGASRIGIAESDDNGATWNIWSTASCSGVSGSWTAAAIQYADNFEMSKELTDIAFVMYTTGASQQVLWRELSMQAELNLPVGVTLTEVP